MVYNIYWHDLGLTVIETLVWWSLLGKTLVLLSFVGSSCHYLVGLLTLTHREPVLRLGFQNPASVVKYQVHIWSTYKNTRKIEAFLFAIMEGTEICRRNQNFALMVNVDVSKDRHSQRIQWRIRGGGTCLFRDPSTPLQEFLDPPLEYRHMKHANEKESLFLELNLMCA